MMAGAPLTIGFAADHRRKVEEVLERLEQYKQTSEAVEHLAHYSANPIAFINTFSSILDSQQQYILRGLKPADSHLHQRIHAYIESGQATPHQIHIMQEYLQLMDQVMRYHYPTSAREVVATSRQ
eukprot:scaffold743_cov37-Tisochrysis_lutea.AAC.1